MGGFQSLSFFRETQRYQNVYWLCPPLDSKRTENSALRSSGSLEAYRGRLHFPPNVYSSHELVNAAAAANVNDRLARIVMLCK